MSATKFLLHAWHLDAPEKRAVALRLVEEVSPVSYSAIALRLHDRKRQLFIDIRPHFFTSSW
jgi:hypothetical protein